MKLTNLGDSFSFKTIKFSLKLFTLISVAIAVIPYLMFLYICIHHYYLPKNITSHKLYFVNQATSINEILEDSTVYSSKSLFQLCSNFKELNLPYNTHFDFQLQLTLPESKANFEIGTFNVKSEIYDKYKTVLHGSVRPGLLVYKNDLLKNIHTIVNIIPLLLGYKTQSQVIRIPLFENIINDYRTPIREIHFKINNASLQINDARLIANTQYKNLSYLLYFWPLTTGFIFVTAFAGLTFVVATITIYKSNKPQLKPDTKDKRRINHKQNKQIENNDNLDYENNYPDIKVLFKELNESIYEKDFVNENENNNQNVEQNDDFVEDGEESSSASSHVLVSSSVEPNRKEHNE